MPIASTSRPASSIFGAQLLIVNHALFFSDLALRREGASLLPDYQVVIFDEAHTLEDVAADHLGLQVSRGSVDYLLNKLYNRAATAACSSTWHGDAGVRTGRGRPPGRRPFFPRHPQPGSPHSQATAGTRPRSASDSVVRVRQPDIVADLLSEELESLAGR